jgi:predicted PurR-regulated permease PerM
MDKQLVVSLKTVLYTLLIVLGVYVVYRLGPILGMIVVSLLIVIAVEPLVKRMMRVTFLNKPLPRGPAVILTYLLLVAVFLGILSLGVRPVLEQMGNLFSALSGLLNNPQVSESLAKLNVSLQTLIPEVPSGKGGILSAVSSIYSNFVAIVSILVISIYTSLDWENFKKRFFNFFTGARRREMEEVVNEIEEKMSYWVKGQLTLMLAVGVLSFFGLAILGMPYTLALSIIAGTLEFVPMFGPFISGVLAGIIGFSSSPAQGIGGIVWFIIVQELENNLLVPRIMHKASGFSPLFVLLAILVGNEFFGFAGVILAVPLTMVLSVVVKRLLQGRR